MRLFNYCGSHKSKAISEQNLPISFVANGTVYNSIDLSARRHTFGMPGCEVAMYKAKGKRNGGAILRVFKNGRITFAGMASERNSANAVRALTGKQRVKIDLTSVRCMAKSKRPVEFGHDGKDVYVNDGKRNVYVTPAVVAIRSGPQVWSGLARSGQVSSRVGPDNTYVQMFSSGIVMATGKTADLAIAAVRSVL